MAKEYTNFDNILNSSGLKYVVNNSLKNYGNQMEPFCYHLSKVKTFKSQEYLENGNLSAEGLHSFDKIVLLHIASGLRFEYGIHENYSGAAELKMLEAFVKRVALENLKLLI